MNFSRRLLFTLVCAASFAAGPVVRAGLFAPSGVDNPGVPRVPPVIKAAPTGEILATPPEVVNGYVKLSFARLSAFKFTPPEYDPVATPDAPPPSVDAQIPEAIKKFDGQKAMVTGFMVPTHMEGAVVTEFMLVSSPSLCCYGIVPNMNEWVVVKMPAGAGVPPLMDVPVAVSGKLHVHGQFENGYLTGIYQLDAERVEPAKP